MSERAWRPAAGLRSRLAGVLRSAVADATSEALAEEARGRQTILAEIERRAEEAAAGHAELRARLDGLDAAVHDLRRIVGDQGDAVDDAMAVIGRAISRVRETIEAGGPPGVPNAVEVPASTAQASAP
jgi:glutathione S-transferase